jgi:thiol-disulfide isomerase/thioredoxin
MTKKLANLTLWFFVLGLFVVAGLLLLRDFRVFREEAQTQPIGKTAPDALVSTLAGNSLALSSFRGHPVWLNFFATWCPPCKAEMPQIEQRYRNLQRDQLQVIGIDQEETPQLVARFVKPLSITFPIVIDEGQAAATYSVFALPTSVFIDSRGVVQAMHVGQMTPAQMDTDIRKIMN